ncbi:elongation factor P hydroxylase [Marinomonas epiphytica]
MHSQQIVQAFQQCFAKAYHTCLIAGADEPLYLPAKGELAARIFFRSDYSSSALHEVSHWCIAGEKRLLLEDYGYWYEEDNRDLAMQQAFEKVEVKPQAVECVLHWSANMDFRVSLDNLSLPDHDPAPFHQAVMHQVANYLSHGLPKRAEIFAKHLFELNFPNLDFNSYMKNKYENSCR